MPTPLEVATRALARRDCSERELRERLARAGIEAAQAEEALAALRESGLVDDSRFAAQRAAFLADRGRGDAAIRFELERQGVSTELIEDAVAALEPERERAERIVTSRGPGEKTARLLTQRGFDSELVALAFEDVVAREP